MVLYILRFFVLLAFWLAVSGATDWQHLLAGSFAAILVLWFWRGFTREAQGRLKIHWLPVLLGAMAVDIFKAAWHVAWIILKGTPINPQFVSLDPGLRHPLLIVILANCITLTPGTLSVSVREERILIHALTAQDRDSVSNWRVHKILKAMEG